MEAFRLSAVFTIYVCLMRFERTDGISDKDMDDYCGSRIQWYDDHQLSLQFSDDDECEVTIATTNQFPMMMLYFKNFWVNCINGNVSIKNQYDQSPDGPSQALCGYVSTSKVYTNYGDVKIKYTPHKGIPWASGVFTLIITLYTDSRTCPSWGHVCNNERCIDAVLKCNGYNSCGDNSGCWYDNSEDADSSTSYDKIGARDVGIGIGVAVGVIILIVVSVTVICCRKRLTRTSAQHTRPTAPQMHAVYATAPNPGHFNQGFSHENYGMHLQQTTETFPQVTLLYEQSPPPYDPAWAPKEMKPEGQYALKVDQNVPEIGQKAEETEGTHEREDILVYDNIAVDQCEDPYSTLADATGGHINQLK